jgi:hypothetical protein
MLEIGKGSDTGEVGIAHSLHLSSIEQGEQLLTGIEIANQDLTIVGGEQSVNHR